ncbi:unnamed protein product, partial [Mesorhabditis belari]|uniref:Uncharacterized protein n=1 Tax=Mesorhabditis belari TaxID=2138241 RepID=A0AAF3EK93_9BILA
MPWIGVALRGEEGITVRIRMGKQEMNTGVASDAVNARHLPCQVGMAGREGGPGTDKDAGFLPGKQEMLPPT